MNLTKVLRNTTIQDDLQTCFQQKDKNFDDLGSRYPPKSMAAVDWGATGAKRC